jgi:hypothetical protein
MQFNNKLEQYLQCLISGTSDPPLTKTNEEAVRSLLVITGSPPSNPKYEDFKEIVSRYGEREPFSFPNPFNFQRKVGFYSTITKIKFFTLLFYFYIRFVLMGTCKVCFTNSL